MRLRSELVRIDEQLRALLSSMDRLHGLLDAVVAISREAELHAVLHRIVTTAMDLVGARYGALITLAGPQKRSGPVSDYSETGPDLRLSRVGTTGFEPATP
ncbi:hypothetical protein ACFY8B_26410 [Streptomyces sp. NPDC012751]|uniref:hypothetical protein n=1 Tax=Streptomyces sp. NPDC012751 TaxID=3364846 RepID=UPI0036CBDFB9